MEKVYSYPWQFLPEVPIKTAHIANFFIGEIKLQRFCTIPMFLIQY